MMDPLQHHFTVQTTVENQSSRVMMLDSVLVLKFPKKWGRRQVSSPSANLPVCLELILLLIVLFLSFYRENKRKLMVLKN